MASIFKRGRDKGRRTAPYWIEFVDANGTRRHRKGFSDRAMTDQLAAKLEAGEHGIRTGLIDPAEEKLKHTRVSPIGGHLTAFEKSLANNTPKHVRLTMQRVKTIVEGAGFSKLADVAKKAVQDYLRELRAEEEYRPSEL